MKQLLDVTNEILLSNLIGFSSCFADGKYQIELSK